MTRISLLRLAVGLALAACFSCSEELIDEDLRLAPQSRSMADLVAFLEEHPVHPGRIEPQRIDAQLPTGDFASAWLQSIGILRLLEEGVDASFGLASSAEWESFGFSLVPDSLGTRYLQAGYEPGSVEHVRRARATWEGSTQDAIACRNFLFSSAFAELFAPEVRNRLDVETLDWLQEQEAALRSEVEEALQRNQTGVGGIPLSSLDRVAALLLYRRVCGEVPSEWVAQVADIIHEEVGDGSRNWEGVFVCHRATAMLFFAEFGIPEWCTELGVPSEWEDHWTQCVWSELSAAMWAKAVD